MTRKECLDAAAAAVLKDRNVTHGSPEDSFSTIAGFWSTYRGVAFTPADVAAMMILLKVARIRANPAHPDNYTDAAGFAACGAEVSTKPEPK